MQFRVKPKRVELVRMVNDPETNKTKATVLGSVSRIEYTLDETLSSQLDPQERAVFDAFVNSQKALPALESRITISKLPQTVEAAVAYVEGIEDPADRAVAVGQLSVAAAALRKALKQFSS